MSPRLAWPAAHRRAAMGWQAGTLIARYLPLSDAKRISTFRRSGADCSKAAVPTGIRTWPTLARRVLRRGKLAA